jgi:formiminotetrahydrofolate cyclodeaminase
MEELDKLSINDFISEFGSASPAPGGGSAAALAGATASGLIIMVAKISLNKIEDNPANKEIMNKLEEIKNHSEAARGGFLELITDDTKAFNEIMNCYRMPKGTDEEIQQRQAALQDATKHAAEVPLKTAQLAFQTLTSANELVNIGAAVAITDTGVAGALAFSAVTGAIWNVKINLCSIKDKTFIEDMNIKIIDITQNAETLWKEIKEHVDNKVA